MEKSTYKPLPRTKTNTCDGEVDPYILTNNRKRSQVQLQLEKQNCENLKTT